MFQFTREKACVIGCILVKKILNRRKITMLKTATLPVKGLNFAGCAREIEKNLGKLAGIAEVDASYVSQSVTVTYDEDRFSDAQLRELIKDCGFLCGEPWSETSNPALSA